MAAPSPATPPPPHGSDTSAHPQPSAWEAAPRPQGWQHRLQLAGRRHGWAQDAGQPRSSFVRLCGVGLACYPWLQGGPHTWGSLSMVLKPIPEPQPHVLPPPSGLSAKSSPMKGQDPGEPSADHLLPQPGWAQAHSGFQLPGDSLHSKGRAPWVYRPKTFFQMPFPTGWPHLRPGEGLHRPGPCPGQAPPFCLPPLPTDLSPGQVGARLPLGLASLLLLPSTAQGISSRHFYLAHSWHRQGHRLTRSTLSDLWPGHWTPGHGGGSYPVGAVWEQGPLPAFTRPVRSPHPVPASWGHSRWP